MDFRKVTAIIESEALENVEKALQALNIPGINVTKVKGFKKINLTGGTSWKV